MGNDNIVRGVFDTEEAWFRYILRDNDFDDDAALDAIETREDLIRFIRVLAMAIEQGNLDDKDGYPPDTRHSRGILQSMFLCSVEPSNMWLPNGDPEEKSFPERLSWKQIGSLIWWGMVWS